MVDMMLYDCDPQSPQPSSQSQASQVQHRNRVSSLSPGFMSPEKDVRRQSQAQTLLSPSNPVAMRKNRRKRVCYDNVRDRSVKAQQAESQRLETNEDVANAAAHPSVLPTSEELASRRQNPDTTQRALWEQGANHLHVDPEIDTTREQLEPKLCRQEQQLGLSYDKESRLCDTSARDAFHSRLTVKYNCDTSFRRPDIGLCASCGQFGLDTSPELVAITSPLLLPLQLTHAQSSYFLSQCEEYRTLRSVFPAHGHGAGLTLPLMHLHPELVRPIGPQLKTQNKPLTIMMNDAPNNGWDSPKVR